MTKLTAGNYSFIATIFLGAFLLIPSTEVAAGIALPPECPCKFFDIPLKEFQKYGIKSRTCQLSDDGVSFLTKLQALNGKDEIKILFEGEVNPGELGASDNQCTLMISKGKLKQTTFEDTLSDADAIQCMADIEEYVMLHPLILDCDVKFVFATSTRYSGDLMNEGAGATGLDGGDNICNAHATAAGLPGTYTAWLSDDSNDAKDRVTQATVPYVRTDGVKVADDFADILNCGNPTCLQAEINKDENAVLKTGETSIYTGTDTLGINTTNNCSDWTDTASLGSIGSYFFKTGAWTGGGGGSFCNRLRPIFCFQD